MKNNKRQLKLILIAIGILAVPFFAAAAGLFISLDNFQISDSFGTANNPDMVWTGSNYGLTWEDSRKDGESEIYFTRLNGFGEEVGSEVKVSDSSDKISGQPAIIWTNNSYSVVWSENCKLYFNKLDKDAKKYGGITRIIYADYDDCPDKPSLAWTGINYGFVWQANQDSQIFFVKYNSLLERQTQEIQVSRTLNSENPSLVWNGSEYGLTWQANGDIYFNRLNANGNRQGDDIKISEISNNSTNPEIVWNSSGYGLIWQGYDNKEQRQIYFAQLNENGDKEIEKAITFNENQDYSIYPSIIWNDNDSEYGAVWQAENNQIYFVNLDEKGHWKNELVQISQTNQEAIKPIIALGTSQYAFVWQDTRGENGNEIYFAKLAFSDLAQLDQGILLAFIKEANGNAWMIIVLVLAAAALLLIYRAKRKS